jgi:hypothetical protein
MPLIQLINTDKASIWGYPSRRVSLSTILYCSRLFACSGRLGWPDSSAWLFQFENLIYAKETETVRRYRIPREKLEKLPRRESYSHHFAKEQAVDNRRKRELIMIINNINGSDDGGSGPMTWKQTTGSGTPTLSGQVNPGQYTAPFAPVGKPPWIVVLNASNGFTVPGITSPDEMITFYNVGSATAPLNTTEAE